jgi:hypothetical protein
MGLFNRKTIRLSSSVSGRCPAKGIYGGTFDSLGGYLLGPMGPSEAATLMISIRIGVSTGRLAID